MPPFYESRKGRLLDLPICTDFRGGGHRRRNLDLGTLHLRKPSGSGALDDPGIVGLGQVLLGALDGVRGLEQGCFAAGIGLTRIIGGGLASDGAFGLFFIGYPSCLGSSAGLAEAIDNTNGTPDKVAIVPSTSFIPYSFLNKGGSKEMRE